MADLTELDYAELVYVEMGMTNPSPGYGYWKRETEYLIGRTLQPTEACVMYDMAAKRIK